jgi:ribosomal protein S18 acetylase RimI-like enzyme
MSEQSVQTYIRVAELSDVETLLALEEECFSCDRLSRRSFRHHVQSPHSDLLIASTSTGQILAYGLVLKRQGTRLARLYSLAVSPQARGRGVAKQLLATLEACAAEDERHYMRLEVTKTNHSAIALYQACGYRVFGEYIDYYEDHSDALRMHKRVRSMRATDIHRPTPWLPQNTDFSCGPAALLMAMASLNADVDCSIEVELDIWREATTVFMTSGHGGCHPFGLALAAQRRGFSSSVWVNSEQPLFVDGVRSEHKKNIMSVVHQQFLQRCIDSQVILNYKAMTLADISKNLSAGSAVLILISTYRLDEKKAPHWVVVTGVDENCLFVHDPDMDKSLRSVLDYQYVPIAKDDFEKMSAFGAQRMRAAVTVSLG